MPKQTIYFIFRGYDGYDAYLSKENGCFIHCVSRVLLIADLLVHIINDLEICCFFLLIQRLHVCRLLVALLKEILCLSELPSLISSCNLQVRPLRVILNGSLRQGLLCLFHGLLPALSRHTSAR